jgi:hypothetical protein
MRCDYESGSDLALDVAQRPSPQLTADPVSFFSRRDYAHQSCRDLRLLHLISMPQMVMCRHIHEPNTTMRKSRTYQQV